MTHPPTAGVWARKVRRRGWSFADLEAHVFARYRDILRAMGRGPEPDFKPLLVPLYVVAIATYLGPLFGACAFLSDPRTGFDGLNDSTSVAVSEICFYIGIAGPVIIAGQWWRRFRSRDDLGLVVLGTNVVAGLVALFGLATRNVPLFEVDSPALPVWLVLLATIPVLVAVVFGSRGPHLGYFPRCGGADSARIGALVGELTVEQRISLSSARLIALNALVDRGLIDATRKAEAEACELGQLHTLDVG